MFGYHGNYWQIDLSNQTSKRIPIPKSVLRKFIGGVGLGTWLLHENSSARFDPLSPEAPLIFAFSPLVGTPLTTSAKFAVVAKSPLTQRLNDALSSSHFAIAGKKTGSDAIVLHGRCEKPSILLLDEGVFRLESADKIWGLTTSQTNQLLKQMHPSDYQFALIGLAGENLVRYATISHDSRHAGRGGLGAVMGSKNLKAIGVRGSRRVQLSDPQEVIRLSKDLSKRSFGPATAKYRELGTISNLLTFNRLNALPTRNFQQGTFEDAPSLSGEEFNQLHLKARNSCAACTIGCEHIYSGKNGLPVRLEYESLFALGSLCGIADRDTVLEAAKLCDELGLDTISTGATIGFAMECNERNLIHEPKLHFGNSLKLLETIDLIGQRKGIGDLLSQGTRLASQQIGGEAPEFAPHVKGLEIPGYEPRSLQTMALGFAVNSRGADHNRSGAYEVDFSSPLNRFQITEENVRGAIETEDRSALMDSLILCKFLRGVFSDFFAEGAILLHAVTGWSVTSEELHQTAARILTAKKLFNIREGWTPIEDTLPERFLSERLPEGLSRGGSLSKDHLKEMIMQYYRFRGWHEDGSISLRTLEELGLSEFLDPLAKTK